MMASRLMPVGVFVWHRTPSIQVYLPLGSCREWTVPMYVAVLSFLNLHPVTLENNWTGCNGSG